MTQEKILDKLGKIKAMADSAKEIGNEEEAQAFAAMLQSLLAKHKLEMSDLQYSAHLQDEPVDESIIGGGVIRDKNGKKVMKNYPDVEITSKRVAWCEQLAAVIARAHSCQIMIAVGSSIIWLVGRKSDREIAEYLFITMQRLAEKFSHKEYKKFRAQCRARDDGGGAYLNETYGFKAAWLRGFIIRLSDRFEEEKTKINQQYKGTAIVRVNREALDIKKYFEDKKCKNVKPVHGHRTGNRLGYELGKKAADGLNLKANAVNAGAVKPNQQLN